MTGLRFTKSFSHSDESVCSLDGATMQLKSTTGLSALQDICPINRHHDAMDSCHVALMNANVKPTL